MAGYERMCVFDAVCDVGAGCNPQVSEVRYNSTNGDRRQRQHGSKYRYQMWNSQTWRRLARTGRQRIQPADTRKSRGTGKRTSGLIRLEMLYMKFAIAP